MFRKLALALVVCSIPLPSSEISGNRELGQARLLVEILRKQVDGGAVPRVRLEAAVAMLADAEDGALLERTLYGPELNDLNEEQVQAMVGAAARRVERRQQELARRQELVEQGAVARNSLEPYQEKVDQARQEAALAQRRAELIERLAEMVRSEQALATHREEDPAPAGLVDRYDGRGLFGDRDLLRLEAAFQLKFLKPLPVSAKGETALHRALGFDHRSRVDVAVHPDEPEGMWLRKYLIDAQIPFFSFRHFERGRATAAHIHIGPQSAPIARLANGG